MMKKLLVIFVFLLSPLFVMATDYYSVTADVLNVRNQPSKSGAVVGVVKSGDVVVAQSNDYEGWMKVSTSSVSGYVSSKYLRYSHSKDTSGAGCRLARRTAGSVFLAHQRSASRQKQLG